MIPSAEVLPAEPLTYANHNDWRIQTGFTAVDQAINPVLSETPPDIVISGVAILLDLACWYGGNALLQPGIADAPAPFLDRCCKALRPRLFGGSHHLPFVAGIFRTKIYLPSGLSEQEQPYILLHEQAHIRRFDPLFSCNGISRTFRSLV